MLATAGSDDGARCHQRVQTRSSPHKVVVGVGYAEAEDDDEAGDDAQSLGPLSSSIKLKSRAAAP